MQHTRIFVRPSFNQYPLIYNSAMYINKLHFSILKYIVVFDYDTIVFEEDIQLNLFFQVYFGFYSKKNYYPKCNSIFRKLKYKELGEVVIITSRTQLKKDILSKTN